MLCSHVSCFCLPPLDAPLPGKPWGGWTSPMQQVQSLHVPVHAVHRRREEVPVWLLRLREWRWVAPSGPELLAALLPASSQPWPLGRGRALAGERRWPPLRPSHSPWLRPAPSAGDWQRGLLRKTFRSRVLRSGVLASSLVSRTPPGPPSRPAAVAPVRHNWYTKACGLHWFSTFTALSKEGLVPSLVLHEICNQIPHNPGTCISGTLWAHASKCFRFGGKS